MAISYIGGKARIGKWIERYIPRDIETYVEPFSGMFWVFFNMDLKNYPNLRTVVYNDFNKLNANLFRCAKHYDRLWEELEKYPRQERNIVNTPPLYVEIFNHCQKEVFDPNLIIGDEPDFIIAGKYIYVLTQVFSGSKPETSTYTDYKGKYRCKVDIFMDKLKHPKYREHFDRITFIENQDFEIIIEKYDSSKTYFYLDPPYWKTENYYSAHDFDNDDHARLAGTLTNIKGRFGLSYYEFSHLKEWFPEVVFNLEDTRYWWARKDFKKAAAAKRDGTQNVGTELLIMNYQSTIYKNDEDTQKEDEDNEC